MTIAGNHQWTIADGPDDDPLHGYEVRCACGLYLIACVDLVGGRPVVALYLAGKAREQYDRNRHRCPL